MNTTEFSNHFDVLFNNTRNPKSYGVDEYEKSVFLTKAQTEIIRNYFNPKGNKFREGFDGNQERQIEFSKVVKTDIITTLGNPVFDSRGNNKSITLPNNILGIINEKVGVTTVSTGTTIEKYLTVVPITMEEYDRLTSKPFKFPLKDQAWRLINVDSTTTKCDLIVNPIYYIRDYTVRYVKKPTPIILLNLSSEGLTIEDSNTATECELSKNLHWEVLKRAVELARASYAGNLKSQLVTGKSSQTNYGQPLSK